MLQPQQYSDYHYKLALATGMTKEKAKLFATAMTHSDAPDLNRLRIIKPLTIKTK